MVHKNTQTKKITVIRAVYFYNSGSIFATKNFVTESVVLSRSFMWDILALLDRENVGWKWCITFWVKMKKHGEISNLLSLKTSLWKRCQRFSVQCIQTITM